MRGGWAGLLLAVSLVSGGAEEPVSRIGFGSCYKPEKKTALWKAVSDFDPQVWLWLGDNVYADVIDGKYIKKDLPKDAFTRAYRSLGESEGMAVLKRLPPGHMMATWDDHDYGLNDAGKNWERKEDAKKAFVKFWGAEEREDGVYSARDFGPEGKRIRVILLDTRYNRDDAGPNGDILGPRQWQWLEEELRRPGAQVILLGSSIQVLPEAHRFEKWANFTNNKKRLLQILQDVGPAKVVLLSGDRHHAEILQCALEAKQVLFEGTSSGLTEGRERGWQSEWASLKGARPWRYRDGLEPRRISEAFFGRNFGTIELWWGGTEPVISLAIRTEDGQVVRKVIF